MNMSGDAAEQVVRLSLEGTEMALRLSGSAAKNIAAAIYTVLKNKDRNKTKGRQRLSAMLKSGKPLKVFTVNENQLKQFASEAKRYGVVYCALQQKGEASDGMVDVMVRAEDASKIDRIVERFKLSTVDTVSIKHDIEQSRAEKEAAPPPQEHTRPGRSPDAAMVDDMLSPIRKEERTSSNPTAARTEGIFPSAPSSKGSKGRGKERPSVREALREIQASLDSHGPASPSREEQAAPTKGAQPHTHVHQPPKHLKKSTTINKER